MGSEGQVGRKMGGMGGSQYPVQQQQQQQKVVSGRGAGVVGRRVLCSNIIKDPVRLLGGARGEAGASGMEVLG